MNTKRMSTRQMVARMAALDRQVDRLRGRLARIGDLRPGSLTRQYRNPANRRGAYWQLSYTHRMKSRTDYVRAEFVPLARRHVAEYKQFKRLVDRWIELGMEKCKLLLRLNEGTPASGRSLKP